MGNAVNVQLVNRSTSSLKRRKSIMTVTLWSIQVLLALLFLLAGISKLIMPIEMMLAQMPIALPGLFLRFLGVAEIAGALGLILPGLLRIRRGMTPLAGICLTIIMIGATVITLLGGDGAGALFPLIVGLLCVIVAYGRRSWGLV